MEVVAADEALLAAASGLSAGLVAEGVLRRFSLGIDLRRFEAGRLPLNLASVVLELELPQELAGGCWSGEVPQRVCCKIVPAKHAGWHAFWPAQRVPGCPKLLLHPLLPTPTPQLNLCSPHS